MDKNKKYLPTLLLIVLISSPWSWQILSFNLYLFSLVWLSSVLLYLSFLNKLKKAIYFFCLLMILMLIFQWQTTAKSDLFYMNPTEQDTFNIRRSELPTFTVDILGKLVNFNSGKFLENKMTFVFYKLEQNFFRSIDPNIYFFGGHPREREGIREFEKFPFLFLPFFIGGLIYVVRHHELWILLSLLLPLVEISIIGHNNPIGPFSLFPFFVATITIGMTNTARDTFSLVKHKLAVIPNFLGGK